ncbi:MAG: hypothetical protein IKI61_01235 [Erysipelotrichaceae bacterium]|nr:hypothetical protein [Erysipelotrichaceae bacterium]
MKMKKIIAAALISLLLLPVSLISADENKYEYKVTIYSGTKAVFEDGTNSVTITVDPDSRLSVSYSESEKSVYLNGSAYKLVMDTDSKYELLGFKKTGYDNNQYIVSYDGSIFEDQSFVMTYGVEGSLIKYSVVYQTSDGTVLGSSEYKGKVGDKPIVAALAFDGYLPDAYNRTRTLKQDGDNTFVFTYHAVSAQTVEEVEYITQEDGTVVAVPTSPSAPAAPSATADTTVGTEEGSTTEPVEILDEDVPLAAPDSTTNAKPEEKPAAMPHAEINTPFNRILLVSAFISLLILMIFIFIGVRRDTEEEY